MTSIKKITYSKGSQKYTLDARTLLDDIPQGSEVIHGKVKLSDQVTSTEGVLEGVASTPKAVKTVNDNVQAVAKNIGNLNSLTTKVKDNLVNAINEVNESSDVKFVDRVPEVPEAETLYVVPNDTNEYDIIPDVYATKKELNEVASRHEVKFVDTKPDVFEANTLYAVKAENSGNIISDTYASKKDLSDLRDSVYLKSTGDPTFYVSATGDDNTADGSQEKPFAKLKTAVNYVYNNVVTNRHVVIKFLSDYTQVETLSISHEQCARYFIFNANGFNVTLGNVLLSLGRFSFEGINFKQNDPKSSVISIKERGIVFILGTSKIEVAPDSSSDVFSVFDSSFYLDYRTNITFTSTGTPTGRCICLATYGSWVKFCPKTCILGDTMTKIPFFRIHLNSCVLWDGVTTFSAPTRSEASAYEVRLGAHLSFNAHGKPRNMGEKTNVDGSSSVS